MQTAHVVFNPASGSYSAGRAARILTALRRAGIDPQPLLPGNEAEAIATVRELCDPERQPLIIAAGGDGTINTVINGLTRQGATLGVIPLGTANVLAWELGIRSLDGAVQRIAAGTRRQFSVGEATSATGSRRFLLMAGVGIDGAIVAGMRAGEKRCLGKLAYLLSALRTIRQWDRTTLTVSDGQRSSECHSVVIANASHYGGPYRLAPQAAIFSSHLDVVPLFLPTRLSFFRFALPFLLTGKWPGVEPWQMHGGQLTVSSVKAVQLDGDSYGAGPVTVRLIADFNPLLC